MTLRNGVPIGRVTGLFYNSGTRASPTWVEIVNMGDAQFTPPEKSFVKTEWKGSRYELSDEGGSSQPEITFNYFEVKGITDAVWTALLAMLVADSAAKEFKVLNDQDGTASGAAGWQFFAKLTETQDSRALASHVSHALKATGVTHIESSAIAHPLPVAVT